MPADDRKYSVVQSGLICALLILGLLIGGTILAGKALAHGKPYCGHGRSGTVHKTTYEWGGTDPRTGIHYHTVTETHPYSGRVNWVTLRILPGSKGCVRL